MKVHITRRPCLIGPAINSRREKHGQELKTAMDIPVSFMLSKEELGAVTGDKFAHQLLFNQVGQVTEPALGYFETPFVLKGKHEGFSVVFEFGINNEQVSIANVKLKRIALTPTKTGGHTELETLVQCIPELDHGITTLLAFIGKDGHVEMHIGDEIVKDEKQKDLPFKAHEDGEDTAAEDKATPEQRGDAELESAISRKIRASEAKKKRGTAKLTVVKGGKGGKK